RREIMKNKLEGDIYFTPKQAAEYFNLSLSTIKNYIYAGKLHTLRTPGGHHRINKSTLLAALGSESKPKNMDEKHSLPLFMCDTILNLLKVLGPAGETISAHCRNVAKLSSKVAEKIGMSSRDVWRIKLAALVHDVGSINVGRDILLKKGPLTTQEYNEVKKHPTIGHLILNSIDELSDISDIVAQHHERIDGSGYPSGLKGEDIHKGARIISVAEAYDSMISKNYYKTPVSKEQAIAELIKHKGTQFDKDIVEAFAEII
ncbi:HD domain-containing phosphohydrolase, partial [Candidatus Omnitrophota bacterium]